MEQQSAALRALPHPATTTGIQQPASTSTMNHDQVSKMSEGGVNVYIIYLCCYVPVKDERNCQQ